MKIFLSLKSFGRRFWKIILEHKIAAIFIALVVIGGGYYFYNKLTSTSGETRYVLAAVSKGTLIMSVSGSGQVSASNQLDLKPTISGDVISVAVLEGSQIKSGELIARIDSRDAEKSVRDAQANFESAELSLQKLKQPADTLSLLQAENALTQAQQSKQNSQNDLIKAYDDGFNAVANAFLDLPGVVSGLDSILNGTAVNGNQTNAYAYYDMVKLYKPNADQFRDSALTSYQTARVAYEKNLQDYRNASRYSDRATIEALISETYETTKAISEAVKNTKNFLDLIDDAFTNNLKRIRPSLLSTHQTNAQNYTGTTNTHLADLLNLKNTIKNDQDAIVAADRTIAEKTESLAKLKAGADPLDIKSQELAVKQRENALRDAQENLSNYFIRAPFNGILAKINVKKGDSTSQGTAIATIISGQKIAEISLNEVDIAKIKIGQKTTLTFDAVPDFTVAGEVVQMDTIGTVTQGVVNYNVKIAFDAQDERIKPGMSVSASIVTDIKQDVLMVPNGAVKSQGTSYYVEIFDASQLTGISSQNTSAGVALEISPSRQAVEIGASNDSMTEIVSGLKEGDQIVSRTITAASQSTTQQSSSGIRIPGIGGGR